jgi:sulfite exporter TauE/SafE
MPVGGKDERKTIFGDRKMNLCEVTMKYIRLVVFIRHDSAEIGGLYALTLGIGTLKIMASTGVFVRVICALKHSISSLSTTSSIILP